MAPPKSVYGEKAGSSEALEFGLEEANPVLSSSERVMGEEAKLG